MQASQASRTWASLSEYSYRLLSDLTIGVMGMGSIGKHVASTFEMLGATVVCFLCFVVFSNTRKFSAIHICHSKS